MYIIERIDIERHAILVIFVLIGYTVCTKNALR